MKSSGKFIFSYPVKNSHLKIRNFKRCASTGLGLWNEVISSYHKQEIERYWSEKIHNTAYYKSNDEKKLYILSMFPYPSGSLHMGHVRVYTMSDTIARFYKMQGKNVIHPMGWDAFGLPAENAAIERQVDPAHWTQQNILNMRKQLYKLGCTFDTHRELSTCDPEYYRWTQELFLKLFENDLVYQKQTFVNWDPVDETVLADEQVDSNNRSWRSGAVVEKRLLKQWFIKTTAFAESLFKGLMDPILKDWKDVVKIQQHWIGECTGINIDFSTVTPIKEYPQILTLWTDKPEFIEHTKFLSVSSNSPLAQIEKLKIEKTIRKLNVQVMNPFTNKLLPVYVTEKETLPYPNFRDDYLGFPCASKIDQNFCELNGISYDKFTFKSQDDQEEKRLQICKEARDRKIGGYPVSSKLKDWLISRQRYWGTPIPVTYCNRCGCQPVSRNKLPVLLPKLNKLVKKSHPTLKDANQWMNTICSKCKGLAIRETDTMDTFVDSSWYYMRYIDPKNYDQMFSKQKAKHYLPVDLYIGGKEHAVLHLYYARFINHFLHHLGLVPSKEPFKQLLVQGMVMGQSYKTIEGKYLKSSEVILVGDKYIDKETQNSVIVTWEKMSKSKFNGVDPLQIINEHSTDTLRLVILSDVAPTSHRNWSKDTFPGILNWQKRLWLIITEFIETREKIKCENLVLPHGDKKFYVEEEYMFDSRNYYVHGITFNMKGSQQLSVAISKMQGLTNSLKKASTLCISQGRQYERALGALIIMLAPYAPHFASELWSGFCSADNRINDSSEFQWDKDVLEQMWPEVDMKYALKVRVRVNGKDFTKLKVARQRLDKMKKEDILDIIMEEAKFKNHLQNRQISKVDFLAEVGCGASINIVTKKKILEKDCI